ncbi:Sec-independent protein translocase subunit TatB [Propioniciclava coleopterorum]|uniref:Sec-independent protein translocase subunit TatB n=1 Tax=Propioniciclava coleopterorum TaxID=2714937 RepID=A0A6G7Y841_9ACTN|nr:sec-independent translocase [Propioniciclava coleopterorum]QIK72846.1 Sec-independent protein translocase subunit TatB [Propioniciclava coleopterorum]
MPEIIVLGALAIIIFGPEKLPELARKAARVLAYLRKIGDDARGQLREELGPEFDNFNITDLNPKNLVARHLLSGDEIADFREMRDDAIATGQLVKDTVSDATGTSTSDTPAAAAAPAVTVPFDPEAT